MLHTPPSPSFPFLFTQISFQISNSFFSFFILLLKGFLNLDLLSSQFTHLLHESVEDQLEDDDFQSNWQMKYLTPFNFWSQLT
uniref:Uncharacterized protein n=1 Tax=Helianthus annuus TaxID=4232 RepID=A0A251TIG9_HELAN